VKTVHDAFELFSTTVLAYRERCDLMSPYPFALSFVEGLRKSFVLSAAILIPEFLPTTSSSVEFSRCADLRFLSALQ
jgi:hypothetical protein